MRRTMCVSALAVTIALMPAAVGAQNGKPFKNLQTQIDALAARVATTETSIADLEARWRDAEARLDAQGGTLQELVEADRALQELIAALQQQGDAAAAQIESLELALQDKQAAILQSCAPGSSIRQVNSDGTVACEVDDAGSGGAAPFMLSDFSSDNVTVPAGGTKSLPMFCPTGYRALSGGYIKGTGGVVTIDVPDNNGWRVVLNNNTTSSTTLRVIVRCATP